jgi:D-serine deaminase-like pyridoxal phosphate-dependent protein
MLFFDNVRACARMTDGVRLAGHAVGGLLITRPVIRDEDLRGLHDLLTAGVRLSVAVDHYRHVELLSNVARSAGVEVGVMIDIDAGAHVTGVRPGPDAARLALAAAALPFIRVDGVHVDGLPGEDDRGCVSMAEHALLAIRRAGVDCDVIVCGIHIQNRCSRTSGEFRLVHSGPLFERTAASAAWIEVRDAAEAIVEQKMEACVLSRPALDWCVIDRGRIDFGDSMTGRVQHPAGAVLDRLLDDVCTLRLAGESLDLTIGELVTLVVRPGHG